MPDISFPSSPSVNDTYTYGGKTWIWNGSYWALNSSGAINGLPVGNASPSTGAFTTLSSTGNTTLGNIAGNLIPAANVTYDLGSSSRYWNDLYLAGNTIYLGNLQLKEDPTNALSVYSANGTILAPVYGTASDAINAISSGTAQFVTGNAQGNITSVGTLTSLSVTGNITGDYIFGNGSQLTGITASGGGGNVTASTSPPGTPNQGDIWIDTNSGTQYLYFNDGNSSQWAEMEAAQSFYYYNSVNNATGGSNTQIQYNSEGNFAGSAALTWDGSTLSITGAVSSNTAAISGNITAGNVSATLLTGTLSTAAQPNVTSLGTLSALTVNGLVTQTGNFNVTGNINVTGNVNATGNLNYDNVTDLVVGDPLIYLGANNTGNVYDLGFVVSYNDGTYQHGGLVRDATDGTWKLFGNVVDEPTTVVNFANAVYQPLRAGAITSTAVTATGNVSANNVSVTANLSANVITENSSRVATMGKSIAMSIVFGG